MTQQKQQPQKLTFFQIIARMIMRIFGWKFVNEAPDISKYVLIGAHHTSGWDLPVSLMVGAAIGKKLNWFGKDSLFKAPWGWFLRFLGGIPVNRRVSTKFVDQIVTAFKERDKLIVAITPEGTRRQLEYWKSGFYYIALGANVPVVLGFADYKRKLYGLGPAIYLTGDVETDFAPIRQFYADKVPKYPEKTSEIKIRSRSAAKSVAKAKD